jgi:hypothetical protein
MLGGGGGGGRSSSSSSRRRRRRRSSCCFYFVFVFIVLYFLPYSLFSSDISLMKEQFVVTLINAKLRFPHYKTVGIKSAPSVRILYPQKQFLLLKFL